jgi:hypothetical protein
VKEILLNDAANAVRIPLLAGAIAALAWLRRVSQAGGDPERGDRFVAVLAVLSVLTYFHCGYFHGPSPIHASEMFHYHLASKYFRELGYDGLYGAALAADADNPEPRFADIEWVRDLRTGEIVRASIVRGDPSFRQRFSAERWEAFRRDLAVIQSLNPPQGWQPSLLDHGYNAPPARTLLTWAVTSAVGQLTLGSATILAFLDVLLLAVLIAVVFRLYGVRSAAFCVVLFGANPLSAFDWIGGSLLRFDWLVLSGLGICALFRQRFALAGALIGGAAMFRIFPAFFALGVVLKGVFELLRTRSWPARTNRFLAGFTLAAAVLLVASTAVLGGDSWLEFYAKIRMHLAPQYLNHVGLRALLDQNEIVLATAQVAIAGAFFFGVRRVSDVQAAILGGTLIFAFGYLASYYYCFLVLFVLWQPLDRLDRLDRGTWLFFGLLFLVPEVAAVVQASSDERPRIYGSEIYPAASAAALLAFAALYARIYGFGAARLAPTAN